MGAFSVFKDKRSKRNKQETPTVESHYSKLARRTSIVRYVCMILIVLFAAYSFSFHSNEITMDNFRYMMKFINLGEDAEAPKGTYIAFDGSEGNRGILFKGDLAVLNESGLTITGWDGEVLLRSSFAYDHPKMTENGTYLFCYDLGSKDLKIFNSYQQMPDSPTFDYPIKWLAASAHGEFAVVSSAKSYRSAVFVYDSEYRIRYSQKFGDKYVDFVDISKEGNEFITAAHYSKGGNLITVVSKFKTDSEGPVFTKEFIGEMPLGIYYTDEGYCLMTTDKIRMFKSDNSIGGEIDLTGKELISGRVFGNRALVTYGIESLSGGTEVVIYRADGSVEFTESFDGSLSDAIICGNALYAVSPGELTLCELSSKDKHVYRIPSSYSSVIADGESIILFSENQAEYFKPSDYTEKVD